MAYVVSLYLWILIARINPLWLLVVPALHSLQYLAVVWRYQTNVERDDPGAARDPAEAPGLSWPALQAAGPGIYRWWCALGYLGFWLIPFVLTALIPYDKQVLGSSLFFFIRADIHQRASLLPGQRDVARGNPEVSKYLFR